MLNSIPAKWRKHQVYRMASFLSDTEFLRASELDPERINEVTDLLRETGNEASLNDLLDAPFRPKRRLEKAGFPVTRYSDGSFAVFYGALEVETALAEVRHHFTNRFAGKPDGERVARYQCFVCDFTGSVKDLRPKRNAWPDLTHGSDYGLCNRLGAEAKQNQLQGLLAPSARCEGTTHPVFERSALSNARDLETVAVT